MLVEIYLFLDLILNKIFEMSTELHPPLQNRIINSVTNAFKIIGEHHVLGLVNFEHCQRFTCGV